MKKINAVLIIVLLLTLAQTIFSFVDLVELYTQAESKAEHMNLTKHNDVTEGVYSYMNSKLSISLVRGGENSYSLFYTYEANDENEAITAFAELSRMGERLSQEYIAKDILLSHSIWVNLSDERCICASPWDIHYVTDAGGEVSVNALPDWMRIDELEMRTEYIEFIKNSVIDYMINYVSEQIVFQI